MENYQGNKTIRTLTAAQKFFDPGKPIKYGHPIDEVLARNNTAPSKRTPQQEEKIIREVKEEQGEIPLANRADPNTPTEIEELGKRLGYTSIFA